VPEGLVRRFAVSMRDAQVIVIDENDHGCCWAEIFKGGQSPFPLH